MVVQLPELHQPPLQHDSRAKEGTRGGSFLQSPMFAAQSTDSHGFQKAKMLDGSSSTLSPASSQHGSTPSSQSCLLPAMGQGARELNKYRKVRTIELLSRSIGVHSEHRQLSLSNRKTPSRVNSAPLLKTDSKRRIPQPLLTLVCDEPVRAVSPASPSRQQRNLRKDLVDSDPFIGIGNRSTPQWKLGL